jgi:hypothetical protein
MLHVKHPSESKVRDFDPESFLNAESVQSRNVPGFPEKSVSNSQTVHSPSECTVNPPSGEQTKKAMEARRATTAPSKADCSVVNPHLAFHRPTSTPPAAPSGGAIYERICSASS